MHVNVDNGDNPMAHEQIEMYEFMWTSHKDNYWLVEAPDKQIGIFSISQRGLVIIEDNEIYRKVKQNMHAAGVKVIPIEEAQRYESLSSKSWSGIYSRPQPNSRS